MIKDLVITYFTIESLKWVIAFLVFCLMMIIGLIFSYLRKD